MKLISFWKVVFCCIFHVVHSMKQLGLFFAILLPNIYIGLIVVHIILFLLPRVIRCKMAYCKYILIKKQN